MFSGDTIIIKLFDNFVEESINLNNFIEPGDM